MGEREGVGVHGEAEGMLGEGKEEREGGKVYLEHTRRLKGVGERSSDS